MATNLAVVEVEPEENLDEVDEIVQAFSEQQWDGKWPRYDATRGCWLCEPCWNTVHWRVKRNGKEKTRISMCHGGGCQCLCIALLWSPKVRRRVVRSRRLPGM